MTIAVTTGVPVLGIMAVAVARTAVTLAAMAMAATHLDLVEVPGAGFGGLSSLLFSYS